MFVQIDELPSIYSRPRLSRRIAPRPSTSTSSWCPGARQSRIFVNGCQINSLSVAISASVSHLIIGASQWINFFGIETRPQSRDCGTKAALRRSVDLYSNHSPALRSLLKFLGQDACCNSPLPGCGERIEVRGDHFFFS